jgi:hypothetical protein
VSDKPYFVLSLRDHLAYRLHNALDLLHGAHNATLDQLKFRADGCTQFLQRSGICVDVLECVRRLGELPEEVILGGDRVKEDRKVLREAASAREKR